MSDKYDPPPPYEARSSASSVPQSTSQQPARPTPPHTPSPSASFSSASRSRSLLSPSFITSNDAGSFLSAGAGLDARAAWSPSSPGDIDIWLNLKERLPPLAPEPIASVREYALDPIGDIPSLNIVMFAVGKPGDVQTFITLAAHLILVHGHTVRIATHSRHEAKIREQAAEIKRQLEEAGRHSGAHLQYFKIADLMEDGNPASWSKNPSEFQTALIDLYRATHSQIANDGLPFAPDLIVASPLALGHVHIAEWCGLPLHIMSSSPWSPTTTLAHPYTTVQQSNADTTLTNYLTFGLMDNLLWRELGGLVNNLRAAELGLPTLNGTSGPGALDRLKVPFSYTLSSTIFEKPPDWPEQLDVTGFIIDEHKKDAIEMDSELVYFLKEGRAPIFVSLDLTSRPGLAENALAAVIAAIEQINARAIMYIKGRPTEFTSPDIFAIPGKSISPSQWLLSDERVSAVIHDGDAQTTAAAIQGGVPAIVLRCSPGADFLGKRLSTLRAGGTAVSLDDVTADQLAIALENILAPETKLAARELGWQIKAEDGVGEAARSIHRHLPLLTMKCDLIPSHIAPWYLPDLCMRLSATAAGILVAVGKLEWKQLIPNRPKEHPVSQVMTDPAMGGVQSLFTALTNSVESVARLFDQQYAPPTIDTSVLQLAEATRLSGSSCSSEPTWNWDYEKRIRGSVTDVKSGIKEAKAELIAGVRDGMMGVVMEPWKGIHRSGPIGGVIGMVHGSVGIVTRPVASSVRALALGAQGAVTEYTSSSSSSSARLPAAISALGSARRQMSERAAGLVEFEDRRRILEAYKRAKAPPRVFERQERLESILRGADVKTSRNQDAGVVLGEEGLSPTAVTAVGKQPKAETKWWKGKGKGKAKEEKEVTRRSSTSTEVGSSRYQGKEAEAKAEAEAEAKRSAINGPSGEQ